MNVNETLEMRENGRKVMGCIFKTTRIAAAIYHKLQNLVPNQSLVLVFFYTDIW